jgi:chromate transporter
VAGISFAQALKFWLKLGFISFGGPAGQIATMHRELVERRRWISEGRFLRALNYCMVLPGPEAQQLATYLGWLMHRTWGGVLAGVLFVLPSLVLLIGLSWVYLTWGQLPAVAGVLYGVKPVVAGIVLHAVWRIGGRTLRQPRQRPVLWLLATLSFVAIALAQVPFPWVIAVAALAGVAGARWAPAQFAASPGHAAVVDPTAVAALIDDDTPPPDHARFRRGRLARVLAVGLALWLAPMAVLIALEGWQGTLTQMAWFFSKAAMLTFGGAYAVLPYVYQGAVEHYQWVSGLQMIDGLALGETTPGPLIMVVAFVGFLGGWARQVLGPEAMFLGATLAACVVVWFTFLPSFIFILAGAPLVESTHGQLRFTAPLTAITAAVVGVIASLGVFFIGHVAWGPGGVDVVAVILVVLAVWALVRRGWGVIAVIAAGAAIGLALRLAGLV